MLFTKGKFKYMEILIINQLNFVSRKIIENLNVHT